MATSITAEADGRPASIVSQGSISAIQLGKDAEIHGPIIAGGVHVYPVKLDTATCTELSNCLKEKLKFKYRKIQIPKQPWLGKWYLPLKDYFVDLTMTDKTDKRFQHRTTVLLQNIFRPKDGIKPTRILIEGPAGYGKTTLAHKLCYDFGCGEAYLRRFHQIVLISLREFEGTLEEMILKTLNCKDHRSEDILSLLKRNQSKVAYILDGLDELPDEKYQIIMPLLKSDKYPQSTVIVTSRLGSVPLSGSDLSMTNLLHCYDRRIEIKGVTGKSKIQFLHSYFRQFPEHKVNSIKELLSLKFGFDVDEGSTLSKLFKRAKRWFLTLKVNNTLFDCPLFLLLLVTLAMETDIEGIDKKTDLYKALFNFVVRRTLNRRYGTDHVVDLFHFDQENPPSYVCLMNRFGELSFEALATKQFAILEETVQKYFGEDKTFLTLGFLTHSSSAEGILQKSWYEPVHLSLLEFAAAYHLYIRPSVSVTTHLCEEILSYLYENSDSLVISFYKGLIEDLPVAEQQAPEQHQLLSNDCTLCDCPIFVHYLVNMESDIGVKSVRRKTQIYKALLSFAVGRSLQKKLGTFQTVDLFQFEKENIPVHAQMLNQFGKLAVEALISKKHTISKDDLRDFDVKTFVEVGVLTQAELLAQFVPVHLSLLEFAAAYHIWFIFRFDLPSDKASKSVRHHDAARLFKESNNTRDIFVELRQEYPIPGL